MKGEETAPAALKPATLELPASLVRDSRAWDYGQRARRLLALELQMIGFRNDHKSTDLESVDWKGLYVSVTKK